MSNTVWYKIIPLEEYLSDAETQLNTIGADGYELLEIYNGNAILISGSSGITITGTVILPDGVVSSSGQVSYLGLSNIPAGILSSSTQINALSNVSAAFAATAPYSGLTSIPSGIVSGAAQIKTLLPAGTVSSSVQINTGSFSGSFTGTFIGTASWSNNAISSSYALSSSYAVTASFIPRAYGQWYSVRIQSSSADTATAMYYDSQSIGNGFIFSGSKIYALRNGVYNVQFSAQFFNTANTNVDIDVWFKKDGLDVPNSTTLYQVDKQAGTRGSMVAALNYLDQINSGSFVEIVWSSTASTVQLYYTSSGVNPTRPAVPSVITTITQVE